MSKGPAHFGLEMPCLNFLHEHHANFRCHRAVASHSKFGTVMGLQRLDRLHQQLKRLHVSNPSDVSNSPRVVWCGLYWSKRWHWAVFYGMALQAMVMEPFKKSTGLTFVDLCARGDDRLGFFGSTEHSFFHSPAQSGTES